MIVWLSARCLADTQPPSLAEIFVKGFAATDRESRLKLARTLLSEVEAIYNAIPNLSPEQARWLAAERERILKLKDDVALWARNLDTLMESKEFRLEKSKNAFGNLQIVLRNFNEKHTLQAEVSTWVAVAWQLVDRDPFAQLESLEKEGLIKVPKNKLCAHFLGDVIAHGLGREILRDIVLPGVNKFEAPK